MAKHIHDYLQRCHSQIDGWFNPASAVIFDSLLDHQERKGVHGHLLEIGVWHGKSAALMVMHTNRRSEDCVLVDLELQRKEIEAALLLVRDDLDDRIVLVESDSRSLHISPLVATGFGQFRWVHIDGEHTAGAVTSDLELAHALLATNGIVCIDDFMSWMYPQITESVFRYLRRNPDHFRMLLCGYNKAYLARPRHLDMYGGFCRSELVARLESVGVLATLARTTYGSELDGYGIGPRFQNVRFRGPDWEPLELAATAELR